QRLAHLESREHVALEERHAQSAARQVRGDARAARAAADDRDVGNRRRHPRPSLTTSTPTPPGTVARTGTTRRGAYTASTSGWPPSGGRSPASAWTSSSGSASGAARVASAAPGTPRRRAAAHTALTRELARRAATAPIAALHRAGESV